MAVSSTQGAGSSSNAPTVDSSQTGFNGLTSDDFLKLLITQLQNQDPSNPTDSDQLLNQISQMRALQSNIELSSALTSLTSNQQLASATSFLGKQVTGLDANKQSVSGSVGSVVISSGTTYLGIGNSQVALGDVTNVSN